MCPDNRHDATNPVNQVKQVFPFIEKIPSTSDVDGILERVRAQAKILQRQVDSIIEVSISDTRQMVRANQNQLSVIRQSTTHTEIETGGLRNTLESVSRDVHALTAMPEQVSQIQKILDEISNRDATPAIDPKRLGVDAQNAMASILREWFEACVMRSIAEESRKREKAFMSMDRPLASSLPSHVMMTLPQLLSALDVPLEDIKNMKDLEAVFGKEHFADHQTQEQSGSLLLQQERFRQWCSSTQPDILLIDGNPISTTPAPSRVTAITTICATLVMSVAKGPLEAVPLYFFCGQHTAGSDPLGGPEGIMRVLVARLLLELYRRQKLRLDFIDTRPYREALERRDLRALCFTFQQLVRQFDLDTFVYCIVDGIFWCERSAWVQDLYAVVGMFNELVRDTRLLPIFKVLMTSPVRSRFVSQKVARGSRITLMGPGYGGAQGEIPPERLFMLNMQRSFVPRTPSPNPQLLGNVSGIEDDGEDYT